MATLDRPGNERHFMKAPLTAKMEHRKTDLPKDSCQLPPKWIDLPKALIGSTG
ncbi:hypothetical protein U1Q18_004894, partial [Sarracenia purpurea var. burkii]